MNARVSFLSAALVAAAAALPLGIAAQGFEGVVKFQMSSSSDEGPVDVQYSIKGQKVRMDISTMGMEMFELYDAGTGYLDVVIPQRQMYMEHTSKLDRDSSKVEKTKVEWTGKKETIAGHECEHAKITGGDGDVTDVCLAKGLGMFVPPQQGVRGREANSLAGWWSSKLGETFPLKVERDGHAQMVATSIEKKSLDGSLFTIPSGYTKMSMPGGGRR